MKMETRFPENMKATLKSIREMRGYKQDEAAKMIGIATDTLRNYEQGKSYPDIPVLRKIEETYNVIFANYFFTARFRFNRNKYDREVRKKC